MTALVRHVGFIRNVMIGRRNLTAERLLDIARVSGAENPTSHLATGNLAFDADPAEIEQITCRLESGIAEVIEGHEPVFVRSVDHLARAAANDPYARNPVADVHHRCVTFMKSPPSALGRLPVHSKRGDVVIFAIDGLDGFSVTRLVDGRAASPGPMLERATGEPVTSRNWNTVEHVLAKQQGQPPAKRS